MRTTTALLSFATIGLILACGGTRVDVEGERAGSKDCLEGAECWAPKPSTPGAEEAWEGLIFSGQSLYDTGVPQLGPVLEGGDFILDFGWESGSFATQDLTIEIGGDSLVATMIGNGQAKLHGAGAGSSQVRVLNADGLLVDWLTIETVELTDIEVVKVADDNPLVAGCSQMVGVRLIAEGSDSLLRAIDDDVVIYVDGEPAMPDPGVWDCFIYDVPSDATEVEFEVRAGGESFFKVLPVSTEFPCGSSD